MLMRRSDTGDSRGRSFPSRDLASTTLPDEPKAPAAAEGALRKLHGETCLAGTETLRKMFSGHWQKPVWFVILCASCLLLAAQSVAEAPGQSGKEQRELELNEAQVARQAAEEKTEELRAELRRREQELQALQERYAELYLASRRQQQELEDYELRLAGLLADREDPSSGRALARALAALDELRVAQLDVSVKVREFQGNLNSVLDALQPSEATRRELIDRLDALNQAVERSVKPWPSVAGRGQGITERLAGRVLAVNDLLQVIVLDKGYDHGVRPGLMWRLLDGEKVKARLKVIEVRASISAAVVTEGKFDSVGPGVTVKLGE
ncbi:MAG: hypothetical protein A3K19_11330 [Lentisphaerae bacterium RIFOXYB12_FULL_65_16]|nr:MAG: hypothetical protein A3K18_25100 [Lentisphaerae bacterium RIFOXYA12_64_32]OGV90160.1 MAG: hypothetical protein A3K19_11330 [Lentisphaerae bacterium RIFOXYB12_FULL_65_16]